LRAKLDITARNPLYVVGAEAHHVPSFVGMIVDAIQFNERRQSLEIAVDFWVRRLNLIENRRLKDFHDKLHRIFRANLPPLALRLHYLH
jgi:hypothetical protein